MTIPELEKQIASLTERNDALVKRVLDIVQDVGQLRAQLGVERIPEHVERTQPIGTN